METFNREQRSILDLTYQYPRASMVVSAGPGTGKTTSLVLRAQALLRCGVAPDRLACITFTHAAAEEIASRLRAKKDGDTQPGPKTDGGEINVQTFHAFLLALLRMQIHPKAFKFVSPEVWVAYYGKLWLPTRVRSRPRLPITDDSLFNLLQEIASSRHSWLIEPPDDPILQWVVHELRSQYLNTPCPLISTADLESYFWLQLHSGHLAYFPYEHLLIDEFQDTSEAQFDIATYYLTRAETTLFVVGDSKQSIYAFRRAHVENFDKIKRQIQERGGNLIELIQNYRSVPEIVDFCNRFEAQMMPTSEGAPLVSALEQPKETPSVICEPIPSTSLFPQLALLATESLGRFPKTAILFRTHLEVQKLLDALPKSVREITQSFTRETCQPARNPILLGLLFGYLHALFPDRSLYTHGWKTSVLKPTDTPLAFTFQTGLMIRRLLDASSFKPTSELVLRQIQQLTYLISEAASLFLPFFPIVLESCLLEWIDPLEAFGLPALEEREPVQGRLSVITLHSAKGLEFDHVILPMTQSLITKPRAYHPILDSEEGWAYRYRATLTAKDPTYVGNYHALKTQTSRKLLQEQFRLYYVALSRAKSRLTLLGDPSSIPKELQGWWKWASEPQEGS
jgi:superfamily I DNA/RNA helicase